MYTLTERRFAKAKPILDKYRRWLLTQKTMDCRGLERELRAAWDTGYKEIRDIARQLLKKQEYREYRLVAVYYMERSEGARPSADFFSDLDDIFGPGDRKEGSRIFWEREFALESLTAEQQSVLLNLHASAEQKESLRQLAALGLIEKNGEKWDYTVEGEDQYDRLKKAES